MQNLISDIKQNFERHGTSCEIFCRDDHTLIISDIFAVSQREIEFLLAKLPECEFVIENSEVSKSGMIVIVSLYEKRPFISDTFFLQICVVILAAIVAFYDDISR